MIYGILIGLILTSALTSHMNHGTPSYLSEQAAIARQLTKIASSMIFVSSSFALIGLLITGS